MELYYSRALRDSTPFYIELSLNIFKNYILLIEENFENRIKKSRVWAEIALKKIDKNDDKFTAEYANYLSDSVTDQVYETEVEFINRFRSSIVIQLYSFLEFELKFYCEKHSKENYKEYSIYDSKGHNEIDKIKKYLKQSASIDLTKLLEWKFITDIKKIRNIIVHNISMIDCNHRDYDTLKNFSRNNYTLKPHSKEEYEIVFDKKEFIDFILKQFETFLVAIVYI